MTTQIKKQKLNPKQELFCQLYASEREFFGNGTQAYIEAYDVSLSKPGAYKAAQAAASRLLSNVIILERIDEHLDELWLNDVHVDKQLGFWLTQKAAPQAAVAAIKEYNVLKNRITHKLEISGLFAETRSKIGGLLDEPDDSGAEDVQDDSEATEPKDA